MVMNKKQTIPHRIWEFFYELANHPSESKIYRDLMQSIWHSQLTTEFTSQEKSKRSSHPLIPEMPWVNVYMLKGALEVNKQHPAIRKANTRDNLLRNGNAYSLSHGPIWTLVRKMEQKSSNIQTIPGSREKKPEN